MLILKFTSKLLMEVCPGRRKGREGKRPDLGIFIHKFYSVLRDSKIN